MKTNNVKNHNSKIEHNNQLTVYCVSSLCSKACMEITMFNLIILIIVKIYQNNKEIYIVKFHTT